MAAVLKTALVFANLLVSGSFFCVCPADVQHMCNKLGEDRVEPRCGVRLP